MWPTKKLHSCVMGITFCLALSSRPTVGGETGHTLSKSTERVGYPLQKSTLLAIVALTLKRVLSQLQFDPFLEMVLRRTVCVLVNVEA